MIRIAARALVVVALCLSVGGHWVALQSVAWATMLVEYSQTQPLAKAVAETFDGDHPCDLCKHASSLRHSEKKPDAPATTLKTDLLCVKRTFAIFPSSADLSFPAESIRVPAAITAPPYPPPRSLA